MSDVPKVDRTPAQSALGRQIGAQEARKLQAKRATQSIWLGLGKSGIIGWSVSILMLAGAGIGLYVDSCHPSSHSWTLMLLITGLLVGCLNAGIWIAREQKAMRREAGEEDDHE